MERRRSPNHPPWFYESQTRPHDLASTPLVPEAAHIADRFLLGLQQEAHTLAPLFSRFQPVMLAARDLSQILLPETLTTSSLHTLTLYDRLSTALTVAQAAGIQRLCNHYSARLNPLPGPDSSRESNNRLTQITQYARQLATQPAVITLPAIRALEAVGLTEPDIVTLTQLIGFVSYQARVVASLQAMMAIPLRWNPGLSSVPDASVSLFDTPGNWQPMLKPVEPGYASDRQQAAITHSQDMEELDDARWLLAHDAPALYGWVTLKHHLSADFSRDEMLAQAVSARILGCHQQFARLAGAWQSTLLQDIGRAETETPLIAVSAALTRVPARFSAVQLQPLLTAGWGTARIFTLLQSVAFANWQDRLLMALGESR